MFDNTYGLLKRQICLLLKKVVLGSKRIAYPSLIYVGPDKDDPENCWFFPQNKKKLK